MTKMDKEKLITEIKTHLSNLEGVIKDDVSFLRYNLDLIKERLEYTENRIKVITNGTRFIMNEILSKLEKLNDAYQMADAMLAQRSRAKEPEKP